MCISLNRLDMKILKAGCHNFFIKDVKKGCPWLAAFLYMAVCRESAASSYSQAESLKSMVDRFRLAKKD